MAVNRPKEQIKAEYEQLRNELRANADTMPPAQLQAGLKRAERLAQEYSAATAEAVQREEQEALRQRPLTATGEQPSAPADRIGTAQQELERAQAAGQLTLANVGAGFSNLYNGVKQAAEQARIAATELLTGTDNPMARLQLREASMEYAKQQDSFRAHIAADAQALGGHEYVYRGIEEGTSIGTEMATLGLPASFIRTGLVRIGAEGGLAALGGAIMPTATPDDRLVNMLAAGTVGTGMSTGVWALSIPFNSARKALETGRTGTLENLPMTHPEPVGISGPFAKEAQVLAQQFDPNIKLTPAMLTQSEEIAQMERAVTATPGSPKARTLNKLEDQVFDNFVQVADKLNPERLSLGTVINQSRGAMTRHRDALVAARKKSWNDTMDEVVEATGGKVLREGTNVRRVGGRPVIQANTFMDTMTSLIDDATEGGAMPPEAEKEIMKFANRWADKIADGKMTAADTQRLLVELTDEMGGSGPTLSALGGNAAKRWAGTLKDAVMDDIDSTVQAARAQRDEVTDVTGAMEASEAEKAANLLMKAREDYTLGSQAIENFEAKALWRTLNQLSNEDGTWFDKVMRMEPEEISEFLKYADEAQPGLANAARGRILMQSFDRNRLPQVVSQGEARQARYNLSGVLGDLLAEGKGGVSRFEALFPAGTKYSAKEIEQAKRGLKVLQLVTKPNLRAEATSFTARTREAYINVVSRSPEFFSRWIIGDWTPMHLEKLIYGDGGIQALMNLGKFEGAERLVIRPAGQGARPQMLTQALASFVGHGTNMLMEEKEAERLEELDRIRAEIAKQSAQAGGTK